MTEILFSGNPDSQFKRLKITPKRTYADNKGEYSVYECSAKEFKILDKDSNESEWTENDCAWIHAKGSNLGSVDRRINLNGHYLHGWSNPEKGWDSEDEKRSFPKYQDIFEYLENVVGATSWRNVSSCLYCLASQNSIKLSELLTKYYA